MSDPFGRLFPGLDPFTGVLAAGALTAILVVLCALALMRAGHGGRDGAVARVTLLVIGAAFGWLFLGGSSRQDASRPDVAAERRGLETRGEALAARAMFPGSPLACLDAVAGEAVETSCERALFAAPEALAAAVSYVAAQLSLFADASAFARRHGGLDPLLAGLRRALESDRYGLVAHVLATRDGCTAAHCPTAALLRDVRRVNANLAQRSYYLYVAKYSAVWPQTQTTAALAQAAPTAPAASPDAQAANPAAPPSAAPVLPSTASAYAPRVPGPDVFFPSSDSIPPVSIMTAEPAASEPETTGAATSRPPAVRKSQPRSAQPKQQAPIELNTAGSGAPPARP